MNIEDISTQLMYTTMPVHVFGGNKNKTVTGFVFSVNRDENKSIPLLITSYHMIKDVEIGVIELHIGKEGIPQKEVANLPFDNSILQDCKLGSLDLVAIPIGSGINELQTKGTELFFRSIDINSFPKNEEIDDLASLEEVVFIGFPDQMYDTTNKIPVIRHGTTATPVWNKYQGKEEFLIDAGVIPEFEGSPVFVYNRGIYHTKNGINLGSRVYFVGVLDRILCKDNNRLGLGVITNCKVLYKELNNFVKKTTGGDLDSYNKTWTDKEKNKSANP